MDIAGVRKNGFVLHTNEFIQAAQFRFLTTFGEGRTLGNLKVSLLYASC